MIEDLVPQNADHVKGLSGRHGIYEHVAMYANEMLGIQDTVLVLGIKALTTCLLVGFSVCSGPDWVVGRLGDGTSIHVHQGIYKMQDHASLT